MVPLDPAGVAAVPSLPQPYATPSAVNFCTVVSWSEGRVRPKGSRSPSSPEPGTPKGFVAGAKELGHEVPDGEAFLRAQQGKGFAWGPRRAALAPDQLALARRLLEEGRSASEVAAMFKVHRATLYWALGAAPPATKIAADAARPRR